MVEVRLSPLARIFDALRHAPDFGDRSSRVRCARTVMAPTTDPIRAGYGVEVNPWGPLREPCEFDCRNGGGGRLLAIESIDPVLAKLYSW